MFKSNSFTLLYIESDPEIREKHSHFIRENGLKVLETDNSIKACELFRTQKVDMILIDLQLSNENGLDFVRCLRHKDVLTPVIITSTQTNQDILMDAINLNTTRYLQKPLKKNDLIDALQIGAKKILNCRSSGFSVLEEGYSYDPINKTINRPDGTAVQLSKKEYLLLELLISKKRLIVPYEVIESIVWQDTLMSMDALRTLVRGIRKKSYPNIISNINGIGYKLDF
ncbi:response regulator transcription factor [Sulfuricurvum sp.]|uniref:response regulator transcription factor n=1 Tax=Sulfuricurvum sp. TaxID=2025608 RepID=UPI002E3509D6|nr:response regulator [Sulfuricurvum sp.]HEX5329038.1 response regulator [Sulfuricurvum sp.]